MDQRPQAIFPPGGVLPAEPAYGALLEALGPDVNAVAKELEMYAGDEPRALHSPQGIRSACEAWRCWARAEGE